MFQISNYFKNFSGGLLPRKQPCTQQSFFYKFFPYASIPCNAVHCCCYFLGISRIDKKSSVICHLGESSVIRSDNWESCMHGFKHGHTESFDKTRKYKRLCFAVKIRELRISDIAQ